MANGGTNGRRVFDRPRVYAAGVLFGLAVVMVCADIASADYVVTDTTLAIVIGSALALVGIEIGAFRRGDK